MTELLLAFACFIGLHSIPALPPVRRRLVAALGRPLYLAVYSLVSVAVLAWLFAAALAIDYIEIWAPDAWQAWVTLVAAPLGLFLVLAGLLSPNPFSISLLSASGRPGAIVTVTRHPVLWGFLLWALAHVLANGDVRSILLFGGLAAFSLGGLWMLDKRARRAFGTTWPSMAGSTSLIPFAAMFQGRTRMQFDAAMAAAALSTAAISIWLLCGGGHLAMFGVDPMAMAMQ